MSIPITAEERAALRAKGFVFDSVNAWFEPHELTLAADAQPTLVTVGSAGIPAFLTNYLDPKFVKVLYTPMKSELIYGSVKKGDWTTKSAMFPIIESTGETSSYGDFNQNGLSGFNANFPQFDSYLYQIMTVWGDYELEVAAQAKIDVAARKQEAAALVLNKMQNKINFFGIAGLKNYGILNFPDLSAPIAPCKKTYNSNVSGPWVTNGHVTATPTEIYEDVLALFYELVSQTGGIIEMTDNLKLCMSPTSSVALQKTNETFATNVMDLLKKNFPNLTVETAVEYSTTAGEVVQMMVAGVDGQETGITAFNEKMRAFPIIRKESSFVQKKMQGSFGTIIFLPTCVSQMLGV